MTTAAAAVPREATAVEDTADTAATAAVLTAAGAAEDARLVRAVREALAANAEALDDAAGYSWRSSTWGFVQRLKAEPALVLLDADAAADVIEDVLLRLSRDGELEDFVGEADVSSVWVAALGDLDSAGRIENPLEDFLSCWSRARATKLRVALARADGEPAYLRADFFGAPLSAPRRAPFRRFLAVCMECCALAEDGGAPLSVKALAELLGSDKKTVSKWRREAQERGFIVEVSPASTDTGERRAAEFRWVARTVTRLEVEPARYPAARPSW